MTDSVSVHVATASLQQAQPQSPKAKTVQKHAAQSQAARGQAARWRTGDADDPSRAPIDAGRLAGGTHGGSGDEPLAPVRRSIPAWLVSMIFHTIALMILAIWTTPLGQGIGRVVLEFGEATESSNVDLDTFSLESVESVLEDSDADVDMEMPVELNLETMMQSIESPEVSPDVPVEIGLGPTLATGTPMFSGRSGAMKKALLATYGGSDVTVDAVSRGLRWLARNQEKPGSWSMRGPFSDGAFSENRAAATAMALLAFLGDGHTHQSETEYSGTVERGLNFLLSLQNRDGFFASTARDHERAYAQAQAMIAVCEAYALTRDSKLRGPAQAAIDYAVQSQSPQGGWRYQPRTDSDLSVTGWFLMGLISGKSAGLDVDSSTLNQVNNYLNDIQAFDGAGYPYQRGWAPSPAMTAEGLLCRQYLGWPKEHPAMVEGVTLLTADWPLDVQDRNVYYWYYATQVLHHYGESPWVQWNAAMSVDLPRIQIKRGDEAGSWSPAGDKWGQTSGRLFTTCLSIYCLEVYYRHLPLYTIAD